jgi:hypothetical protein
MRGRICARSSGRSSRQVRHPREREKIFLCCRCEYAVRKGAELAHRLQINRIKGQGFPDHRARRLASCQISMKGYPWSRSASENLTVRLRAVLRCIGSGQEERRLLAGLSLAHGAPCVATEGNLCLCDPPSYDEDGIYLDSLRSAGRGGRSACRARAFAPDGRGRASGIVDRRPGSPTAPSGSSVSASTQRNPNRPTYKGRCE